MGKERQIDNSKLEKKHILIIGDIMLDYYLWGNCSRISPEAPTLVVEETGMTSYSLGGCGNVASNLSNLNCEISLFSMIGDDEDGLIVKNLCKNIGIDSSFLIKEKKRKTTKKTRIFASNQNILRIDKEDVFFIDDNIANKIIKKIEKIISKIDIVIISDYNKGCISHKLSQDIINISNKNNKKVLIDPKGDDFLKYKNAFLVTPNKSEAKTWSKLSDIKKMAIKIKEELNLKYSIITLSKDGIAYLGDDFNIVKAKSKEVFDVSGAGDIVIATISLMIANGFNMQDSINIANHSASIAISKIGNYVLSLDDLQNIIKHTINNKQAGKLIKSVDEIIQIVKQDKNKKIIFTNGCFDLLHIGHCRFLKQAKELGDILIIGLNSDKSVQKIKGKDRPIINEDDRAEILLSLKYVDYVVLFDELSPYSIIKAIKPDILLKGGDYKIKDIIGHDIVKDTRSLKYVKNKSTSCIVDKITKNTL